MGLTVPDRQFEESEWHKPKETLTSVFSTAFDKQRRDGTTESIGTTHIMDEAQKIGPKVSPELIKSEFDFDVDVPTTRHKAQIMKEAQLEHNERMQILVNAPDTFWGSVAKFSGAITGAVSDPIDLTISAILGAVTGGIATAIKAGKIFKSVSKTAILAAKLKKAQTPAEKAIQAIKLGRKTSFGIALVENSAANAVTESFAMKARREEGIEYTTEQMLFNVFGASIVMTSAFHGAGAVLGKLMKAGPKHVEAAFNTFDIALDNGKDPKGAWDIIAKHLDSEFEIDEGFQGALELGFGDKAAKYLEGSEDIKDVLTKIQDDFVNLELSPDDINNFFSSLDAQGINKKRLKHLIDNPEVEMPLSERQKIRDDFLDRKTDLDYDEQAQKVLDDTPDKIKQNKFDDDELIDINERYNEVLVMKEEGLLDEFQGELLDQTDEFTIRENERVSTLKEMAKDCFGVSI